MPGEDAERSLFDHLETPSSARTDGLPSPTITAASMNLGAVLGAAIGDAMGHPTEFIGSFSGIQERYGQGQKRERADFDPGRQLGERYQAGNLVQNSASHGEDARCTIVLQFRLPNQFDDGDRMFRLSEVVESAYKQGEMKKPTELPVGL